MNNDTKSEKSQKSKSSGNNDNEKKTEIKEGKVKKKVHFKNKTTEKKEMIDKSKDILVDNFVFLSMIHMI